jgi:glycosyltransferase involved in cell wall biosynthesis
MLDPAFAEVLERNVSTAVRAAAVVITAAESARGDLVAAYDLDPAAVDVVPHGVDLERFRPGLSGGQEIVGAAAADAGAPYVAFVGVLHPRKNLAAVRAAVAGLARAGFPHVLAVVGAPAGDRADPSELEREALAELPDAPGRIVRVPAPSDDELAQILAGAAAFCLPSLYEGFGLPCLEAMACGAPVVVSDRGALPELVADAGLVVPPDADAVQEALARVLSEPALARDLRARARARAETFPWSRTVDGWVAALERAAAGSADAHGATLPE